MGGPAISPTYPAMALSPSPFPLSWGGNTAVTSATDVDDMKAAPTPCKKRMTIEERPCERERAGDREHAEDGQADQVEAQAPVLVGEPADGDEEDAHGQHVDGLHPERLGVAETKRRADHRQGDGDHRREERAHEHADGTENEHAPAMASQFGLVH